MIIGLDVGGTHTDVVLLKKDGPIKEVKIPTDQSDLFNTVLKGLKSITAGVETKNISRIVLSTTLTTNAIAENKIPKAGMIVSSGPGIDPEFFRTDDHYYTVSGSIDHRGREIESINENEILRVAEKLKKKGINHIGVVSKFSVRNPEHELKIYNLVSDSFEKVFLGHRISGNLNFPRRIATAFLNAAVYPIHKKFFEAVKKSLDERGLTMPIHILKADGGTISFDASIDFPAQTILSGPAASVTGSIVYASDQEDIVVLDIGGTTTDIAVLIKKAPVFDPLGIKLGRYKTLIRSLKGSSIGIGGDSAVKIDNGHLTIGPERLGPAMGYGGNVLTPTDAMFVLKMIKDGDREKAVKGVAPVAAELGVSIEEAAFNIFDLTCKKILINVHALINQINSKPVYTIHDFLEGYKVNPTKMLVLGGPAPYFAGHLEKLSDFKVSVVPGWKTANATGAALAKTTCEVTLFADTQQGIVVAPEEKFSKTITNIFSKADAVEMAFDLLKEKAVKRGAGAGNIETEIVEDLQFNMVRGFHETGKNIRVKVQIKPGLIHDYDSMLYNS